MLDHRLGRDQGRVEDACGLADEMCAQPEGAGRVQPVGRRPGAPCPLNARMAGNLSGVVQLEAAGLLVSAV